MKWVIILSALVVLVSAKDLYSTENDGFDIDSAKSETLTAILNCFIDKDSCDKIADDFKKDIPEAVVQACAKCTQAQKHIFKVFLKYVKENENEGFQIFQQKYDPQNKYLTALQAAIANN